MVYSENNRNKKYEDFEGKIFLKKTSKLKMKK